jgi:hypothetical protein
LKTIAVLVLEGYDAKKEEKNIGNLIAKRESLKTAPGAESAEKSGVGV